MMILLNGFTVRYNDHYANIPYLETRKMRIELTALTATRLCSTNWAIFPKKFVIYYNNIYAEKRRLELPLQV